MDVMYQKFWYIINATDYHLADTGGNLRLHLPGVGISAIHGIVSSYVT